MSKPNMTKKPTNSFLNFSIVLFLFFIMSILSFIGKLELYRVGIELMDVSNVLFGEPAPSTFEGNQLMPNNNQTAYFVSNYSIKPSQPTNYPGPNRQSNASYSYSAVSSMSIMPEVVFNSNPIFEQKISKQKRNQQGLSNSNNYGYGNFKLFERFSPFQSNLASAQIADNETTSTLFNTSSNDPFRASQADPDPSEPEGSVLPLGNDLAILLLLAGMYAFVKFSTSKKSFV